MRKKLNDHLLTEQNEANVKVEKFIQDEDVKAKALLAPFKVGTCELSSLICELLKRVSSQEKSFQPTLNV